MKNILSKLFLLGLLLTGIAFAGCSKEDDLFAGTDNYITSFSLTKDGVTYKASVTGDKMTISIPKSVDLQGAKVDYKLTEQASITPDPTQIEKWNENHEFIVMSYNKSERKYSYQPSFTEITETGSVVLLTQSDVDKFAASNIEVIDGNLVIGTDEDVTGLDSIKNLNGLQKLRKVTSGILIHNTFAGENLAGLAALESAGSIYIKNLTARKAVTDSLNLSLPNLTKVGDFYVNSPLIREVLLPKLRSAFSFYVNSQSLSGITIPVLETVITDFSIESGTDFRSYATSNKKLKELSLKSLKEIKGAFNLRGLPALEKLDISNLEDIGSHFTVNAVALDKIDAPLLGVIKQSFSLKNVDALTSLSFPKLTYMGAFEYDPVSNKGLLRSLDFPALETVDGDMKLSYLKTDQLNLPALKKIRKQLDIRFCESLTAIHMPVLEECNNIYAYTLPLITSLDISKVKQMEKVDLIACYELALLKGNNNITDITLNAGSRSCAPIRFEGIETIPGTLEMSNYTQNGDFDFPGIKHIGIYSQSTGLSDGQSTISFPDLETIGTLKLSSCSYLNKLIAPELTTVIDLWDTSFMTNVQSGDIQVPKLTKIGKFSFYGGTYAGVANQMKLTNLNDFISLKEVDIVDIEWWGNMTDFSGLQHIFPGIAKENWKVEGCGYNPTYRQMIDGNWIKP